MSDAKPFLELSEDGSSASVRRVAAEEAQSGSAAVSGVHVDDDVLELTQALNVDGTVRDLALVGAPPPGGAHKGGAEAIASRPPPTSASEAGADPIGRSPDPPPIRGMEPQPAIPSGHAIEDTVLEMVAPLLRGWVDENLQPMVERLVKEEVARRVGRIGEA